jgi:hypothetical protein
MTGGDSTYILHEDDCGETLGLALVRGPAGLNMCDLRHEYLGLIVPERDEHGASKPPLRPDLLERDREAQNRNDRESNIAGLVDWLVAEKGFERVEHVVAEV